MLFFAVILYPSQAQITAPHRLVNAPTAGTLDARTYILETHLFDGGGVTQRLKIGVDRPHRYRHILQRF